jgi:hypothetical protein
MTAAMMNVRAHAALIGLCAAAYARHAIGALLEGNGWGSAGVALLAGFLLFAFLMAATSSVGTSSDARRIALYPAAWWLLAVLALNALPALLAQAASLAALLCTLVTLRSVTTMERSIARGSGGRETSSIRV